MCSLVTVIGLDVYNGINNGGKGEKGDTLVFGVTFEEIMVKYPYNRVATTLLSKHILQGFQSHEI